MNEACVNPFGSRSNLEDFVGDPFKPLARNLAGGETSDSEEWLILVCIHLYFYIYAGLIP
jgi:hypothetical protein